LAHTVGADREAGSGNRETTETVAATGAISELHARHKRSEAHYVASVQRQLDDALVLDHAADVGRFGIQHGGGCRHFHGLIHRAYLELEILPNLGSGLHAESSDFLTLEARHLSFDVIVADWHQRKGVVSR